MICFTYQHHLFPQVFGMALENQCRLLCTLLEILDENLNVRNSEAQQGHIKSMPLLYLL